MPVGKEQNPRPTIDGYQSWEKVRTFPGMIDVPPWSIFLISSINASCTNDAINTLVLHNNLLYLPQLLPVVVKEENVALIVQPFDVVFTKIFLLP